MAAGVKQRHLRRCRQALPWSLARLRLPAYSYVAAPYEAAFITPSEYLRHTSVASSPVISGFGSVAHVHNSGFGQTLPLWVATDRSSRTCDLLPIALLPVIRS